MLLLVNTILDLTESLKDEICICGEAGQESIASEKFQNYWLNIIHTSIHIRTPEGLIAKPIRFKVIQNIIDIFLPKDSECIPSTMVSTIIYLTFMLL